MTKLSISQAWSETGAFLARESRLILPIALLFLFIPGVLAELFRPHPDVQPGPAEALGQLLLMLTGLVLGLIAVLAITHLALRPGASVAEALQVGLRRFFPLFLTSLLLGLVFGIVGAILLVALGGETIASGRPIDPANMPPEIRLAFSLLMVTAFLISVRLFLLAPVATSEPTGPISMIRRSWRLTGPQYWKLLGAFLLLLLVAGIVVVALTSLLGVLVALIVGIPQWGSPAWTIIAVFGILLQTLFTTLVVVLAARIYLQLRGTSASDAFA